MSKNIKYIAEIGVNHLGDEDKALRMVENCIHAGVDAVTFQIQSDNYYDETKSFRHKLSDDFYSKLINLERAGRIKLIKVSRTGFGSTFQEAYTVIVWKVV